MSTTDPSAILDQVQAILMDMFHLTREDVAPEKNLFTDLDLDSLDAIDLAAELGTRTQIRFSNDDLRQIRTINDVVQAIITKQSEQA
jgi:acyl carrier protein